MIEAKWLHGTDGLDKVYEIRYKVFVLEQGVPEELERDDMDKTAQHILVYENGKPVGTGRLYVQHGEFRLGRIAVLKECRKRGYGDLAVRMMLLKAFDEGAEEVHIHAQLEVKGFYEKLGFIADGMPFMEAGIEHVPMKLTRAEGDTLFHGCSH